jgi:hypothetical protein
MLGNQKKSLSCSEFMKLLVDGKDIASFIYVQNFIKNETKASIDFFKRKMNSITLNIERMLKICLLSTNSLRKLLLSISPKSIK